MLVNCSQFDLYRITFSSIVLELKSRHSKAEEPLKSLIYETASVYSELHFCQ